MLRPSLFPVNIPANISSAHHLLKHDQPTNTKNTPFQSLLTSSLNQIQTLSLSMEHGVNKCESLYETLILNQGNNETTVFMLDFCCEFSPIEGKLCKSLTKIIAVENSMINCLEEILSIADTRLHIKPTTNQLNHNSSLSNFAQKSSVKLIKPVQLSQESPLSSSSNSLSSDYDDAVGEIHNQFSKESSQFNDNSDSDEEYSDSDDEEEDDDSFVFSIQNKKMSGVALHRYLHINDHIDRVCTSLDCVNRVHEEIERQMGQSSLNGSLGMNGFEPFSVGGDMFPMDNGLNDKKDTIDDGVLHQTYPNKNTAVMNVTAEVQNRVFDIQGVDMRAPARLLKDNMLYIKRNRSSTNVSQVDEHSNRFLVAYRMDRIKKKFDGLVKQFEQIVMWLNNVLINQE